MFATIGEMMKIALLTDEGTTVVPLSFGDRVMVDKGNVQGMIVGIAVYPSGVQYQVAWWANGVHYDGWFYEWRLECVESTTD
jgi:hypothetical protein